MINNSSKINITVSVCIMTYNHEPYIRKCLESILSQDVTFGIEVIINDDCSTDGTTEIIRDYERLYPHIIKPIYHDHNLYLEFKNDNKDYYNHIMFPLARGKYIACCDGDDYWLDKYKLQKQYDILEKDSHISLCYHNYFILKGESLSLRKYHAPVIQDLEYAAYCAHIHTSSMFFRNYHKSLVPIFAFKHPVYQFFWAIRLAEFGNIYYIDEAMSVTIKHEEGIFNGSDNHKRYEMAMGNIDNMIEWYTEGNNCPRVVKLLKKRARRLAKPYLLSAAKHLKLKEFTKMALKLV